MPVRSRPVQHESSVSGRVCSPAHTLSYHDQRR
jgi:hypothetical protein